MTDPLTRAMLDTAFEPHELLTPPVDILGPATDPDAKEVLHTLGIPSWDNPWFDVDDEIGRRLEPVSEWDYELSDVYQDVPEGAENWVALGMVPYDDIAFDPATGKVYCLPQDAEIYLLNSSLRSFVYFLYLLKVDCPRMDSGDDQSEWAGYTAAEHEEIRLHICEKMSAVDPVALENPKSLWFGILTYIVDPEAHFGRG
ncbi:SUKH-4 family immunity protein [Streptomyces sp. NPDC050738]|uniref:SUKH-4 family immunity protein n=1 Tax=Streptomyces sp. NPDC050738 TaxID=3154744 RepID=UPI00343D18B4